MLFESSKGTELEFCISELNSCFATFGGRPSSDSSIHFEDSVLGKSGEVCFFGVRNTQKNRALETGCNKRIRPRGLKKQCTSV